MKKDDEFDIIQEADEKPTKLVCMFCHKPVTMEGHIKICLGVSPDLISAKPTFFRIINRENLCKNCWSLFNENDWRYNQKAQVCHKSRSPQFLKRDFSQKQIHPQSLLDQRPQSIAFTNNRYTQLEHRDDQPQPPNGSQNFSHILTLEMINIVKSIMSPLIRDWVDRHRHVDTNVLVVYLTSAVIDFGTAFLTKPIIVPAWEMIQKTCSSINWVSILQHPENLFNERFIDSKLERITPRKPARVIKSLNRLTHNFKGLIKKRELPNIRHQSRLLGFINIKDLLMLIERLLNCSKKTVVNFGLDLYLILLSGQRFSAD